MKDNMKPIFGVFLLIVIIVITHTIENFYLDKNKSQTIGKIVKFRYNSSGNFLINYTYDVENITYTGYQSVHYFKCPNGTEGCVGRKFTVYYSTKDPRNSDIDLEEFNDKKFKKLSLW